MPDFDKLTAMQKSRKQRWERKIHLRRMGLGVVLGVLFASMVLALSAFGNPMIDGEEAAFTSEAADSTSGGADVASATSPEQMTNLASTEEISGDPVNVLMMGVDRRPDGSSEELGVRSDTIMIVRAYPRTGEIRLLSIPRDMFIEIAPGETDRINVAYAEGGVDRTIAVVEHFTDLDIDNYALVDFAGFENTVDALGGVKVKVKENEYPPEMRLEPGKQKLDGEQALAYARYRYSAGGDLDRIKHQQQIIASLKMKVLQPKTIAKLPELIAIANESVETNVGIKDSVNIVRALAAKDEKGTVRSYRLMGEPTVLDDGRQVLMPKDDFNQQALSRFVQ